MKYPLLSTMGGATPYVFGVMTAAGVATVPLCAQSRPDTMRDTGQHTRRDTRGDTLRDTTSTARPGTLAPVTILRTPVQPINAPLSVAAVAARQATVARPGFTVDEALRGLAGVQVDNRLNFALGERIAIRGIGARSQFGVRGIRVIVDDIPATLADGQTQLNNIDLGSLGSVEVLRGAASALYGNASGGVIALRTAPAPNVSLRPELRTLWGSDGLSRLQLGIGGTEGRMTYRLNGDRLDYHGYRASSVARNAHANSVLTYDVDGAQVKLVANAVQYDAQNPGSLSGALLASDRRQAFANNVAQHTGERGKQGQVGLSVVAHPHIGELRLSGYALHRGLENPIPPSIIVLHRDAGGGRATYSIRTDGAVGARALGYAVIALAGAESDIQHDNRQNYANVSGVRGALTINQRERVASLSPFAQLTATLGPATLLGGVRYDRFHFGVHDRLITSTNPDDSGRRRLSAVSPTIGVTYAIAPALHLYGNFATAFQTPTTTELANRPDGLAGFNPALQPERTRSIEGGANGALGERIHYHAALYQMRIRDALIPFELPSAPGRQYYRNAGVARHTGAEGEAAVLLGRSISARAAYGYVDARFVTHAPGRVSYAGNRVPGIAPRILTVALDAGASGGRLVSLETRFQSATPVDDPNAHRSAGYGVTDLRGELPLVRHAGVFGGIGNLWNTRYNTSVVINAAGGRYYEPAAGRTIYAGLHYAGE